MWFISLQQACLSHFCVLLLFRKGLETGRPLAPVLRGLPFVSPSLTFLTYTDCKSHKP